MKEEKNPITRMLNYSFLDYDIENLKLENMEIQW